MTSPLIADYIKSESRGSASAFASAGMLAGSCFSFIVLVGGTNNMDLDSAYNYAAVLFTILTTLLFLLVREPIIKDRSKLIDSNDVGLEGFDDAVLETEETEAPTAEMTKWEQCKYLTKTVIDLMKSDVKYTLCFAGWMCSSLI